MVAEQREYLQSRVKEKNNCGRVPKRKIVGAKATRIIAGTCQMGIIVGGVCPGKCGGTFVFWDMYLLHVFELLPIHIYGQLLLYDDCIYWVCGHSICVHMLDDHIYGLA